MAANVCGAGKFTKCAMTISGGHGVAPIVFQRIILSICPEKDLGVLSRWNMLAGKTIGLYGNVGAIVGTSLLLDIQTS